LILLEPDIVKIDRVYIDGVAASVAKRRSLERMLKMIWALGAEEIAEGIESGDDLAVLKDIGVRYGQGYLLGEPRKVQPQLPILNDLNPESSDSAPQGTLAGP
jgi:EAL domain-containing protein (putative c-di-GMP-specific phosphodiesterase class I)